MAADALSLTADGEMEYDSKGESSTEYYSQALAVLLGASSTVIDDDDPCDHGGFFHPIGEVSHKR